LEKHAPISTFGVGGRPLMAGFGKSRLSFFRGNCGACADPSVFSLISFEIPSPFPKKNHD